MKGALLAAALLACAGPAVAEPAAEARRARDAAARIEQQWPLAEAGSLTRLIARVGQRLGERAGSTPFPWRFVVVRDRSANAFAIGGGRIYVNEGVVTLCETEGELAAILAHEMAHQLAGHFAADAPATGGAERIDLGAVTQRVDPDREIEADAIALGILRRAGYDPHAALTVALRRQASAEGPPGPGDERRTASLREALRDVPSSGHADSTAYRAARRATLARLPRDASADTPR